MNELFCVGVNLEEIRRAQNNLFSQQRVLKVSKNPSAKNKNQNGTVKSFVKACDSFATNRMLRK